MEEFLKLLLKNPDLFCEMFVETDENGNPYIQLDIGTKSINYHEVSTIVNTLTKDGWNVGRLYSYDSKAYLSFYKYLKE